jgi:hypothetical protein
MIYPKAYPLNTMPPAVLAEPLRNFFSQKLGQVWSHPRDTGQRRPACGDCRETNEALKAQISSLIIAPTNGECRAIAGAVRKAMKENGLLSDSEHSVTRLQRLNLTDSQQRDAVTYEPGQIVEFHRMAKGVVRGGVPEKRFKSGEQWEVLRGRKELSSSVAASSRSSCHLNRHGISACSGAGPYFSNAHC